MPLPISNRLGSQAQQNATECIGVHGARHAICEDGFSGFGLIDFAFRCHKYDPAVHPRIIGGKSWNIVGFGSEKPLIPQGSHNFTIPQPYSDRFCLWEMAGAKV